MKITYHEYYVTIIIIYKNCNDRSSVQNATFVAYYAKCNKMK